LTIGEKIQLYRKQLKMSQDDLGQKLLVSRQTVSLWEKDQTLPSIDNLIRLSDIFRITVDDLLKSDHAEPIEEIPPAETYRFRCSEEEIRDLYRTARNSYYKKPFYGVLFFVLLLAFLIYSSAEPPIIWIAVGLLVSRLVFLIRSFLDFRKTWIPKAIRRMSEITYEYLIFDDHMIVNLYKENDHIRKYKFAFEEIEQTQETDKWIILQFSGHLFFLRKRDLKEDSTFYPRLYNMLLPAGKTEKAIPTAWNTISVLLFVASILSILGAMCLQGLVSDANGLFTENMWVYFLLTPIPISSVVFGIIAKRKGYVLNKNIVIGIIMTILLAIFGSFTFIFPNL